MRALRLTTLHAPLEHADIPTPEPAKGEVMVSLKAAALNHRDVFITQGLYPGIAMPITLGSDGAGEYKGQPVLIDPSFDWGDNPAAQGKSFNILGMPKNGTFAEAVCVPKANLHPKPAHLTWEQAAALPLAGVTAYRTLFTRCQLKKGEKVLISGIGGGVALFAMQFAIAAGANVWVTSGKTEKIEKAVALGAKSGANYRETGWDKQLRQEVGGFDVIVDSAGGDGLAALVGLCNPGGRVGIYGGTLGKVNGLSPQLLFWKQVSLHGSTMGTARDFKAMVGFVARHEIVPVVDSVFPLEQGNNAFSRMALGEQFGKIVLHINT